MLHIYLYIKKLKYEIFHDLRSQNYGIQNNKIDEHLDLQFPTRVTRIQAERRQNFLENIAYIFI